MAAYHSVAFVAFSITILCVSNFSLVSALNANGGFSVELIHRDSPKSPFYNPSLTPSQRWTNAIRRSLDRVKRFNPTASSSSSQLSHDDHPNQAESTLIHGTHGQYLMELSIGTPPFSTIAIVSTASDLFWTQCKPCPKCYNQTDPLFDPSQSSTYKAVPCSSKQCASLNSTATCSQGPACPYAVDYGDNSHSRGEYARETLTLRSTAGGNISFPETLIGCGYDNGGNFVKEESGIVGLGGGVESLITQLDSSIDGKFSYCLVPDEAHTKNTTSKLNFGSNAVVSGSKVVSTPLVKNESWYYLTLEAITVGDTRIPFPDSNPEGNMIIDSGTTLTIIQEDFYYSVENEVARQVGLKRVKDPNISLSLCYTSSQRDEFKAPSITMNFKGADVKLEPRNTFFRYNEEILCFGFAPDGYIGTYGNVAQMNFLVGYDLRKHTLSFKPTDCTKL